MSASGYRIDFFSWHTYNEDPLTFSQDMQNITLWLLRNPGYLRIPRMVTEFGPTGSKDYRYGTAYMAAFTASVVRQIVNIHPKYLFSFQVKDGPTGGNNGWGIWTHEKFGLKRKPRYYIYNFLDRMTGSLLAVRGEGSWVSSFATIDGQTIRVMVINFDRQNKHTETVPLTITNLEPGTYNWKIDYLFNGGCAQDIPATNTLTENVASGSFFKFFCMPPSNVAILEITKQ